MNRFFINYIKKIQFEFHIDNEHDGWSRIFSRSHRSFVSWKINLLWNSRFPQGTIWYAYNSVIHKTSFLLYLSPIWPFCWFSTDTGYYLKLIPNPVKFNLNTFQKLSMKHFGETLRDAPKKTVLDQRNFILVLPKHFQKRFADFFDDLQTYKNRLGIIAYGVQSISLSDVFVKICETVSPEKDAPDVYTRKNSKDEWINSLSSKH